MRHGAQWVDIGVCVDAVPRLADELGHCRALLATMTPIVLHSKDLTGEQVEQIDIARAYLRAAEGG